MWTGLRSGWDAGQRNPLSGIITTTQHLPRSNESAVFLLLKNKLDGSLSHNVGSGIFILKNVYLTTSYFLFYLFPLFTLQVLCGFQFSILHGIPGKAADKWTRYSAFSWALCLRLVCFVPFWCVSFCFTISYYTNYIFLLSLKTEQKQTNQPSKGLGS